MTHWRPVPRRLVQPTGTLAGCRGPKKGWGDLGVTFFHDRLESFPRLADYRLAKAAGYWPYYKTVESAASARFTIEGHDYINFGSNNYLSLSYHPRVIEAAQRATDKYGTGVTGSRLLNGTLDLHLTLEAELADFYGREAALVFSTGLRRQREHDQWPPQPPRLRGPRQGRPQLAPHRRDPRRRDHEAFRSQRPRPVGEDPRRPARRPRQGRRRRRRLLDGWRHRPAGPTRRALRASTPTRSSSTTRPTAWACWAPGVEAPPSTTACSPTSTSSPSRSPRPSARAAARSSARPRRSSCSPSTPIR